MMTSLFQRVCRDYLSVIDAQSIVDAIFCSSRYLSQNFVVSAMMDVAP